MNRTLMVLKQVQTNINDDSEEYSNTGKVINFILQKMEKFKLNQLKEKVDKKIANLNTINFNDYVCIDKLHLNSKKIEDYELPYPTKDVNNKAEFIKITELLTDAINDIPNYSKHKILLLKFVKNQSFKEIFQYMNDYILYDELDLSDELLNKFYNKPVITYLERVGIDVKNDIEYQKGECIVTKKYLDLDLYKLNNNGFMYIKSKNDIEITLSESIELHFKKLLRLILIKEHYTKVLVAYNEKLFEEFPNLIDL